ncbi:MAG: protein kinase domain-containing protein [Bacteroidia bacterium]
MSTYSPNDLFANRYLLLEKIGIGGFSEVWKAEDQMAEDTVVAIKIYAPERGMDELGLKQFRREYAVVLNLNHPSLLTARHFDVFNGSPYLVMPFISGGSVYNQLMEHGPYSEEQMAKLIAQMADAFHFLHDHDVLHQDIKPDNILIDSRGNYLLTDFGISSRLRSSLRKSTTTATAMTVAYAPPERFQGSQEALAAGDIFSFGVLLYELAVGDVPWMGAGGVVVKANSEPVELSGDYSKRFQHLVQACLRFKPEDRPTAADLKAWALEFMREGAWPEIPQPKTETPSEAKEPVRGRSTQRMDDIPSEDPKDKGKEAATLKHGADAMPLSEGGKKGKRGLVAAVIGVLVVGGASAWYFTSGPDKPEGTEATVQKQQFDSLLKRADSIAMANDLSAALMLYQDALKLFPADSLGLASLAWCEGQIALLANADSSLADTTVVASTVPPGEIINPTKPVKKEEKKVEPVVEEKKPTEDELRKQRLKELEGQKVKKTDEYDLTDMSSSGSKYDYKGAVRNGKPHGYGIAYFDDGNRYEGNWENGVRTGSGTYYFSDGTVYVGGWKNDSFSGRGKMTWEDGDKYDGSYSNGKRNGLGTYTTGGGDINNCPDCRKYQGYWKDNNKHGMGKCFDRNGNLLYDGEFRDGKPVDDYPNR